MKPPAPTETNDSCRCVPCRSLLFEGLPMATVVALIVQRVIPPPTMDLALTFAVWITFYPVARLKRSEPWWAHWARGVAVLIAFLLAQRFFR